MAKNYGHRKPVRQGSSMSKQLLLVLTGFLFGYLSASIFDFSSLSNWFNTQVLAQHTSSSTIKPAPQQAQLPKPKFEFYTLLASESSNDASVPAPNTPAAVVAPSTVKPVTAATTPTVTKSTPVAAPLANVVPAKEVPSQMVMGKDAYLVQIAAFKSKPEAERMKALLALKGFAVTIAIVNQQQTNWYRVSVGPFTSKILAQKAQASVANSEHIVGMIRKMDA